MLNLVLQVLDPERPCRFGYDDQLLRQVIDNHLIHFGEAKDFRSPHDIVFISLQVPKRNWWFRCTINPEANSDATFQKIALLFGDTPARRANSQPSASTP